MQGVGEGGPESRNLAKWPPEARESRNQWFWVGFARGRRGWPRIPKSGQMAARGQGEPKSKVLDRFCKGWARAAQPYKRFCRKCKKRKVKCTMLRMKCKKHQVKCKRFGKRCKKQIVKSKIELAKIKKHIAKCNTLRRKC